MKVKLYILSLIVFGLLNSWFSTGQKLIINEFSQGTNGAKEYIELVVVGERTCEGDSCADIRGWIIDDHNGWYGASSGQGIATGHIRFSLNDNWSCVPYGSIILLYNNADKNLSITLPDDPTDANGDNVYVVPVSSIYMEATTATPISPSSLTYSYPVTTYTPGGNWSTIGLANPGDAVIVVDPAQPGAAHHAIAYGNLSGGTNAVIFKSQSGASRNYYLTDDNFLLSASYLVGNAPANETPGVPNTPANDAWITKMRQSIGGIIEDTIIACFPLNGTYDFNGVILTAPGIYRDTFPSSQGCDSVVHLFLDALVPDVSSKLITGCNVVNYNGTEYYTSTVLRDTLVSEGGCDSAYIYTVIQIENIVPVYQYDTINGCQEVFYRNVRYQESGIVKDTIKTKNGCDSIYIEVNMTVYPIPEINIDGLEVICKGDTLTLIANADYPATWEGFNDGQDTITVAPNETTNYVVRTINDLNCVGIAYHRVEVVNFAMQITADRKEIEVEQEVGITVSGNQDFSVDKWFPESLFPNQMRYEQLVTFYQKGIHNIKAVGYSEKNNCVDTAELEIDVLPKPYMFMPNAFSPNGDGQNDFFKPLFIRDFTISNFAVYNRYGQLVYQAALTQNITGWDGTQNGAPCEAGTYFFTLSAISPHGERQDMKGDVVLVR